MSDRLAHDAWPPPARGSGSGPHCITCGDVAEPMLVLRLDAAAQLALCEDARGARHTVEVALVEDVSAGEALLVHAGTAIARAEAAR